MFDALLRSSVSLSNEKTLSLKPKKQAAESSPSDPIVSEQLDTLQTNCQPVLRWFQLLSPAPVFMPSHDKT